MADLGQAIKAGLSDADPNVRQAAAIMAGLSGDKSWVKPLVQLLGDKFWQVKVRAIQALGRLGVKESLPLLMRLLGATEVTVRKRILDVLGEVKDENAPELDKTSAEPPPVLKAAALAITLLDEEVVVKPLLSALASANQNIRLAALAGLGNIRAQTAVEALIKALSDEDAKIRGAAAAALGKIKAESAVAELIRLAGDENWMVRREALIALNHIKAEAAFEALASHLNDPRPEVRRVAVLAVGNTRRPEAAEKLTPLLEDDQPPAVRKAVISSLAALGVREALDPVAVFLGDGDEGLRGEAARAVVRLSGD